MTYQGYVGDVEYDEEGVAPAKWTGGGLSPDHRGRTPKSCRLLIRPRATDIIMISSRRRPYAILNPPRPFG